MREYKIINASTEKTETELNRLAKENWRVIEVIPGIAGTPEQRSSPKH